MRSAGARINVAVVWILYSLLVGSLPRWALAQATPQAAPAFVHGLWAWKSPTILEASRGADKLRDFCESAGINEAYVSSLAADCKGLPGTKFLAAKGIVEAGMPATSQIQDPWRLGEPAGAHGTCWIQAIESGPLALLDWCTWRWRNCRVGTASLTLSLEHLNSD
jgi:hypothetical protein